jgi:hypothetical protein
MKASTQWKPNSAQKLQSGKRANSDEDCSGTTINLFSCSSGMGGGAGILGHTQVIENHADIACELPHFLSDAGCSLGLDDFDGETAESSDVFWPIANAYSASIFVVVKEGYSHLDVVGALGFFITFFGQGP